MSIDDATDNKHKSPFPRHLTADPMQVHAIRWADEALASKHEPCDTELHLNEVTEALVQLRHVYTQLATAYTQTLMFALRCLSDWRTTAENIGPPSTDETTSSSTEEVEEEAVYTTLRECASDLEVMLGLVDTTSPEAQQFLEDEGRWPRHLTLGWVIAAKDEVP